MRKKRLKGFKYQILRSLRILDNKIIAILSRQKKYVTSALDVSSSIELDELVTIAMEYDKKNLKHYISANGESSMLRGYIYARNKLFRATYFIFNRIKNA